MISVVVAKKKPEVRVHATDIHVMCPDHEAQRTDADDGPHHHPITEDIFSGVGADQIRYDAEGRQCHDVDLRMPEEPEQMLKQDRRSALIGRGLPHGQDRRHEKAGTHYGIQQHHDGADQQGGKGQQPEYRGHENAPDGQR